MLMKSIKVTIVLGLLLMMVTFGTHQSSAATYYHANGGGYWLQYGSSWNKRSNDGYCVSGRGPCGSSLWYQQWTYNHKGCGYGEWGYWKMASVVPYYGKVSAWIDGYMGGTMPAANYSITYNYGSSHYPYPAINQNNYYEQFVTLSPSTKLFRISDVTLTDSWGGNYICNTAGGYRVEFDEIKLEV